MKAAAIGRCLLFFLQACSEGDDRGELERMFCNLKMASSHSISILVQEVRLSTVYPWGLAGIPLENAMRQKNRVSFNVLK